MTDISGGEGSVGDNPTGRGPCLAHDRAGSTLVERAGDDPQARSAPRPATAAAELSLVIEDGDAAQGRDVVMARQLLDHARLCGFTFQREAPGIDAALVGHRISEDWLDLVRIGGLSRDCSAWREWTSSLVVSPDELGHREHQVEGSALRVLSEVLTWEHSS